MDSRVCTSSFNQIHGWNLHDWVKILISRSLVRLTAPSAPSVRKTRLCEIDGFNVCQLPMSSVFVALGLRIGLALSHNCAKPWSWFNTLEYTQLMIWGADWLINYLRSCSRPHTHAHIHVYPILWTMNVVGKKFTAYGIDSILYCSTWDVFCTQCTPRYMWIGITIDKRSDTVESTLFPK